MAGRNHSDLTLISVVEDFPPDAHMWDTGQPTKGLFERVMKDRREQLQSLIESIGTTGIEVKTRVVSGTPFLEIIRQVLRDRNDLVMVTAEETDGLKARLFGTTIMHQSGQQIRKVMFSNQKSILRYISGTPPSFHCLRQTGITY